MNAVVREALQAMLDGDWDTLHTKLHPYLRWTGTNGSSIRGRTKVIDMLKASYPVEPPSSYELRDGQIYRWTE